MKRVTPFVPLLAGLPAAALLILLALPAAPAAAQAVGDTAPPAPAQAQELAARAHEAWVRGDVDTALALYERRLAADSTDNLALHRVALASAWRRDFDRSLPLFDRLLARDPDNVEARLHRANALAWSGRHADAADGFRQVLAADPSSVDARKGLARVTGWSGRLRESERQWRDILAAEPDDVDALVGLAANLRWQGRIRPALDAIEAAERVAPEHEDVATQRQWLNAAAGPRVSPSFLYETDSDGNRSETVRVTGNWLIGGVLGARLTADSRDFREATDLRRSGSTRSADLLLSIGLGSGWTISGGGGVRTGTDDAQATLGLWTAGVATPGHLPVTASLGASRTVFDYTAQLAEQDVAVEEVVLNLGSTAGSERLTLGARGGLARFRGAEDNTRWLAGANASYRASQLVSVGLQARGFGFSEHVTEGYWNPSFYGVVEAPVRLAADGTRLFGALELAPGVQTIDHPAYDVQNAAFRASARVGVRLVPGRELGIAGSLANSGLQRVSPVGGADYEYRSVSVFLEWSLR